MKVTENVIKSKLESMTQNVKLKTLGLINPTKCVPRKIVILFHNFPRK